jgi:hypothetical protein
MDYMCRIDGGLKVAGVEYIFTWVGHWCGITQESFISAMELVQFGQLITAHRHSRH